MGKIKKTEVVYRKGEFAGVEFKTPEMVRTLIKLTPKDISAVVVTDFPYYLTKSPELYFKTDVVISDQDSSYQLNALGRKYPDIVRALIRKIPALSKTEAGGVPNTNISAAQELHFRLIQVLSEF